MHAPQLKTTLTYHPPYDTSAMMHFLTLRAVPGLEQLTSRETNKIAFARTLQIRANDQSYLGWIEFHFLPQTFQVALRLSDSLQPALPAVLQQVRWALDLDADSTAIDAVLHNDFPSCNGWRVPGAWDGFEIAVRAILGQQVTLPVGRTLTKRLVHTFGVNVATPWPALTHAFPLPERLLKAKPDELGELGIVKQRQKAIQALAHAVLNDNLDLRPGIPNGDTVQALMKLPGIGDWTAQYIAMRGLRWPDAFPSGDVAIHNRLGIRQHPKPALAALNKAKQWQPWRSYAVIRIWHGDVDTR